MDRKALTPFGVCIREVELPLEGKAAASLRSLVEQHGVAVLKDQHIDTATFIAFLRSLGPLIFTEGEAAVEGADMLNVVSNVGRTSPPRSVFHTDTSYVAEPPSFTALHPVTLPSNGGQTLVVDQCALFDRLAPAEVDALRHAKVKHRVTGLEGQTSYIWHPLFRRHPSTGKIAVFLSTPERCIELQDAKPGAPDINTLYARAIDTDGVFVHDWCSGDILIWDNRSTMHKADHSNVSGDRILHRGMVAGEVPIPAFS